MDMPNSHIYCILIGCKSSSKQLFSVFSFTNNFLRVFVIVLVIIPVTEGFFRIICTLSFFSVFYLNKRIGRYSSYCLQRLQL